MILTEEDEQVPVEHEMEKATGPAIEVSRIFGGKNQGIKQGLY
jgi:hypothetical protein